MVSDRFAQEISALKRSVACAPAVVSVMALGFFGVTLVDATGLPLPGAVIGMLVFLGVLAVAPALHTCSNALFDKSIPHLPLLFVPAAAGVVEQAGHLKSDLWVVLLAVFIATPLTIAATAVIAEGVFRTSENRRRAKQ
jgi:holin-like protein